MDAKNTIKISIDCHLNFSQPTQLLIKLVTVIAPLILKVTTMGQTDNNFLGSGVWCQLLSVKYSVIKTIFNKVECGESYFL